MNAPHTVSDDRLAQIVDGQVTAFQYEIPVIAAELLARRAGDRQRAEALRCPNCESFPVMQYVADSSFLYGVENPITLTAKDVVHFKCQACGLVYTGEDGEQKRDAAAKAYRESQEPRNE